MKERVFVPDRNSGKSIAMKTILKNIMDSDEYKKAESDLFAYGHSCLKVKDNKLMHIPIASTKIKGIDGGLL